MHPAIDSATRFFSVVGAPYIAEHHSDHDSADAEPAGSRRPVSMAALPRPCTTGFWLQDDN